ncbi:MAG: HDIG domain-containing metalloprotein, partial [Bradymonadaceae bacterium]
GRGLPDPSIIGQPASRTLRATHAFTYTETNLQATERQRNRAAKRVAPVYDWNEGMGATFRDRVSRAFSDMRSALADRARQSIAGKADTSVDDIVGDAPAAVRQRKLIEALPPHRRLAFARTLREKHFDTYFETEILDAHFDQFARHGFPPAAENALGEILDQVMSEPVVGNEFPAQQDLERGIYLRRMRGDRILVGYRVEDLREHLVPLRDVPGMVREAAPRLLSAIRSENLRQAVIGAANTLVRPNTHFNESRTLDKRESARASVASTAERHRVEEGEVLVQRGATVTERDYRLLQEMYRDSEGLGRLQVASGAVGLTVLIVVIFFAFGRRNIREFDPEPKDVFATGFALLLFIALAQGGVSLIEAVVEPAEPGEGSRWYYLLPIAAGGMLVRLLLNNEYAAVFTVALGLLTGVVTDQSLFYAAYVVLGSLVGIATLQQVQHRMALMWSGFAVGLVNAASIMAFWLLRGEFFQSTGAALASAGIGLAGGLLSGLFVLAIHPIFEDWFNYTTDIKLLELANLDSPLLRDLIVRAPGTYHHSIMVGSLCEAAAEAIDCNSLLARVGAYYHDIGKGQNPRYFAENQKPDENPHDELKPNMSALIIKNHVKDGIELARAHGLPREIEDFIAQHHGTSLIAYFYHQAKEMEDPDVPEVEESDYRYPGPKPQTRETAICMLADGVEAASRAMRNPTPARLKGLVQKIINRAFTDGQLDECDLTLRDLNQIASAMTRILTGIFHHRPQYPEQSREQDERMHQTEGTEPPDEDEEQLESSDRRRPTPEGSADVDASADEAQNEQSGGEAEGDIASEESIDTTDEESDADTGSDEGQRGESSEEDGSEGDDPDESAETLPHLGS